MAIRDYDRLYIGGDWVAPEGTDTIGVISPVSEEVIASAALPTVTRRAGTSTATT